MTSNIVEWHQQLAKEIRKEKSVMGRYQNDDEGLNQRYTREITEDNHFSPNPFDN